jgi:hypothetical protein
MRKWYNVSEVVAMYYAGTLYQDDVGSTQEFPGYELAEGRLAERNGTMRAVSADFVAFALAFRLWLL